MSLVWVLFTHEHTQEGASIKAHDGPIYFYGTTWGYMHIELIAGQGSYMWWYFFPVLLTTDGLQPPKMQS